MSVDTCTPFPPHPHDHDRCRSRALVAAEELCRRRGLRLTPLRRRVLELVWTSHRPARAYELLDRLRGEHAGAAPPTVYRALEFLQQAGLVHKLESRNAFIGCPAPHHAAGSEVLICRGCGEAAELVDERLAGLLKELAERTGFQPDDQTLEIVGLCAACRRGGERS